MAGKGCLRRPYDKKKWDENYDSIKWKKKEEVVVKGNIEIECDKVVQLDDVVSRID